MLYVFGGLPASGKSTLSLALAHHVSAVYLRIDTIEQSLRNAGLTMDGPAGYMVAYDLALDNLRLGRDVIADSVNPIEITRRAWRDVAARANVPCVEIEVVCSDIEEHRRRVETRICDIPGLKQPDWKAVVERHYEPWTTDHVLIDTAGEPIERSIARLFTSLKNHSV